MVGSWAQLLAVGLTIPRRKLEKVPYGHSKKITQRTRAPSQEKVVGAIYAYQRTLCLSAQVQK